MKMTKKLGGLLLAVLLLLSLSVTAFASEGGPTVSDPNATFMLKINNDQPGHVYKAYQIFTGTLTSEMTSEGWSEILTNIVWGNGLTAEGQAALAAALGVTGDDAANASKVAEAMEKVDGSTVQNFLGSLDDSYWQNGIDLPMGAGVYGATVTTGYYMIKDTMNNEYATDFSLTEYIVQVVGDVNMKPKASVPSVEKKVQDVNDSVYGSATKWQDSADYDIGDAVPFQLTATLPDNFAAYSRYSLVFHDTMSEGLTFNGRPSVKVKYERPDGQKGNITSGFNVVTDTTDGCTFEIVFDNVMTAGQTGGLSGGTKIIVEYTATLNEDATIGGAGNPNEVYLEYSNNPNGEGTGHTPKDKVTVFTFEIDVNKVQPDGEDEDGNTKTKSLAGAEFTLEKLIPGVTVGESGDKWTTVQVVKSEDGTKFSFVGLDDGYYRLTETVTPPGFNTVDPIYFIVEAKHNPESDAAVTDDQLVIKQTNSSWFDLGDNYKGFIAKFTSANGVLSTNIVNQKGLQLPETGGMGTTIFYVAGGILVAVALILLVTKRRVKAEQ